MNDYLAKPMKIDELIVVLQKAATALREDISFPERTKQYNNR
jgi:YesN/AraC family two-component response regulator